MRALVQIESRPLDTGHTETRHPIYNYGYRYIRNWRRRCGWSLVWAFVGGGVIAPHVCADETAEQLVRPEAIFRKPNHFIVNNRQVRFELSSSPQPFVDWGLIRPGFVEYVHQETGEIIPVSDPHPFRELDDVAAVRFGVASGVQIAVQPARRAGTFAELIQPSYPWEDFVEAHTLIYDDQAKLYRCWYRTSGGLAYAESPDAVAWHKPLHKLKAFGDHERTNLIAAANIEEALSGVMKAGGELLLGQGGAFFVDPSAPADQRFKVTFLAHTKTPHYDKDDKPQVDREISAMTGPGSTVIFGAVSEDGMSWQIIPRPLVYHDADTMTVTKYDVLKKKYVAYTRLYELSRRSIGYLETRDFREWPLPRNILTAGPEQSPAVDFYSSSFSFYPGQPGLRLIFCLQYDRATDCSDIRLATSRDGQSFHFTPGPPILSRAEPGQIGHGFIAPLPGLIRTPDDRMLLICRGFKLPHKFPRHHFRSLPEGQSEDFAAWWPADRLAGLEAPEMGQFTTAAFRLRGRRLLLNMSSAAVGGVQVELRDENFEPLAGYAFGDSDLLRGDELRMPITWNGAGDLSAFVGKTIYLRFRLKAAKLFAVQAVD